MIETAARWNTYAILCLLAAAMWLTGCATHPVIEVEQERVTGEVGEAFAGLSLRDADGGGALVSWVLSGPLKRVGGEAPKLSRGDIILEVDGKVLNKDGFKKYVEAHRPGDRIVLKVKLTKGNPDAAIPTPGKGTEVVELPVILGRKSDWTGPAFADTPADRKLPNIAPEPTKLETFLLDTAKAHDEKEPLEKLLKLFADTQDETGGGNLLSHVSYGFHEPMRFPQLCEETVKPFRTLNKDARQVIVDGAALLDAPVPTLPEAVTLGQPGEALGQLAAMVRSADAELDAAFAKADKQGLAALPGEVQSFMDTNEPGQDDPKLVARAMRSSLDVDFGAMLRAAAAVSPVMGLPKAPEELPAAQPFTQVIRPSSLFKRWFGKAHPLAGAVTGDVLAVEEQNGRWYVYGGPGDNSYDLSKIDVVVDPGGNDTYTYPSDTRPRVQVVIDMAGNDTYTGSSIGPAAATLGVSLLVDGSGNDTYVGQRRSIGACVLGVGMLVDYAGNDTYRAGTWSIGCAVYGLGALMDMSGRDVYWADNSSEGLGGPRGVGVLFDANGGDLYRANGPTGSVYGVPGVYYGLSQGVGFGFRSYDTGGIGLLVDRSGNDRYEAGEFSQGGGYYWSLGILDDGGGNDVYYANRYGQGFGCHQALGALIDHAGNDTYWAMTAADQGGAWDIGMGMLLDKQGDDTYHAEGLSQGGAAMQGIAWLLDLDGIDHYVAYKSATQGRSGGNAYHYDRTKCLSWSVLLDAGGSEDFYSVEGRGNGMTVTPGRDRPDKPEDTERYGLFIDTPQKVDTGL